MKIKLITLALLTILTSCGALKQVVESVVVEGNNGNSTASGEARLTEFDVSKGLKEALRVGCENAVKILSVKDGFYKDMASRILLPPDARRITENIKMVPGGQKLVNKVEIRLNRAAEDAVKSAVPIFVSAITEMTIQDAFSILNGGEHAATNYLKSKSYNKLKDLFLPKVRESLDKKLVANISTNESWRLLTGNYNKVANSFAGKIADLKPVNSKLDEYVTEKALEALFDKVAVEESKIRKEPLARVTDLLKKVFGK